MAKQTEKNLVIVESPAKAKTIGKYLGPDYQVKACMGHLRDLPKSTIGVDVDNDFEPNYRPIKGKEDIIRDLKKLAQSSDVVYLATDPDREGEAISWHLQHLLELDGEKAQRVTFNEITPRVVTESIAKPRSIDQDLVDAQQARRVLDRIVGYQISPLMWKKIRRGLSAGRVQSVAARMVDDRDREIETFEPKEFWTLDAMLKNEAGAEFTVHYYGRDGKKYEPATGKEVEELQQELSDLPFVVDSVKRSDKQRSPAPPFTTSTMQQEASRKLNMTPKRTMAIAQQLYEGVEITGEGAVGLITYMRTDSLRISEESRAEGNRYISEHYGEKYLPDKPRYYKSRAGAQDGHEAIRPSNVYLTPEAAKSSLTAEQYKLYSLIWRRFLASLMANSLQDTVKTEIHAARPGDENYCVFTASGYSVRFDGYTALYDNSDDDEHSASLPELTAGAVLKLRDLLSEQHFTQPPMRYTEASLIKTLEETGVGRPSTYASIPATIHDRDYVERESKKTLKPTELGTAITKLLKEKFPKIVNTKFTAGMEADLDRIEAGGYDYVKMLHTFYDEFEETLQKAKDSMEGVHISLEEDKTDVPCEKCGALMVVKVSRYGKFFACPNYPECKFTKPFVTNTTGVCPECGGAVIGKKSKKGHAFFGCSNYPACNFATWDKPTAESCPNCGSTLFQSRGGKLRC
jgi:DNA topoisomerase-1